MLQHLAVMKEPLLKDDWKQTHIELPFEGFTKDAYPNVIQWILF